MKQPSDAAVRDKALDPDLSFAVSAPAGSGKTGLLTQRVLTLLARCEHPEEVLSITFTRKAAGEMQTRIYEALHFAAHAPRPADAYEAQTWDLAQAVLDVSKRLNWQILSNKSRLRVMTIDGLCRSLTQQLPVSSGMGISLSTTDDADPLYREACRSLFNHLEQPGPFQPAVEHLFTHLDNNYQRLEDLLVSLLAQRDQWLPHVFASRDERQYLESVLNHIVVETLEQCSQAMAEVASDLAILADYAATNLLETNPEDAIVLCQGMTGLPAPTADDLPRWQALIRVFQTDSGSWRKRLSVKEGFPTSKDKTEKARCDLRKQQLQNIIAILQQQPGLPPLLDQIRLLPKPLYADQEWAFLDSLTQVLPLLVAQLKLVFRQHSQVDFTEINQAALQALGDDENPTDLALKLDYRIQHILVDEFQDTSVPQLRLLEKLTAGWQPGDGRTLFLVGDGMQSCYGFRGANVGIFLEARRNGIGNVALQAMDLCVNFRSTSPIIDWVNNTFALAFPASEDINQGAVPYATSEAFKSADAGRSNGVTCHAIEDADNRDAEAALVLSLVQQALTDHPTETVAVLVRSRPHLSSVLRTFEQAGLTWQAQDIDPLAQRMPIIDLMSLTRALHDPSDRIAWLALLRGPWCGLDNHDLYTLANAALATTPEADSAPSPTLLERLQYLHTLPLEQWPTLSMSNTAAPLIQRFSKPLLQAWQTRQRKGLRASVEGLWLALGGPASLLEENDLANTQRYFDLLTQHEQGGLLSDWAVFERAVDKLFAVPDSRANPRLQVMTLHKSKGLEFDTVIIPGLDARPRPESTALLLWQERLQANGSTDLVMAPTSATGADKNEIYRFAANENKMKQAYESTRLLYVGCTRAKRNLHLLANVSRDEKKDEIKAPAAGALLASIWPVFSQQMQLTAAPPKASQPDVEQPDWLRRHTPGWVAPLPEPDPLLAAYRGHEFDDEDNLPERETRSAFVARQTGTVLHHLLQKMVEANQVVGLPCTTPAGIAMRLQQAGLLADELKSASERIEQALHTIAHDPIGQWLLDHRHLASECEKALWAKSGSQATLNVIDRTFVSDLAPCPSTGKMIKQPPTRWIIDYKSAQPGGSDTLESFITQQAELYTPQLRRYAKLFRGSEPYPVRTALYFPSLACFHEVPVQTEIP